MKIFRYIPVVLVAAAAAGCKPAVKAPRAPGGDAPNKGIVQKVFGPSPTELVRQMFESKDPDLRRSAIEELSKHDWGRRGSYLKAYAILTADPAATVRSAAVRALGRSGDAKYAGEIISALSDSESSVRWDAAVAMDSIFATDAIEPLSVRATSDVSPDVRVAAARTLRKYRRADVLETLLRCLDDPKLVVRLRAVESLTELTGENAGTDARDWRRTLAGKKDPFNRPAESDGKPWWGRLNQRSNKQEERTTTLPATQPK